MSINKFWSLFALPVLLAVWPSIAFAQDENNSDEGDYEEVSVDQKAPFSGYLFTVEGLAQMLAKCDSRVDTAVLEKRIELTKKIIDIEAELKKKDKEIEIKKEMYEEMLKIRQDRIEQLVLEAKWNKFFIASGFVGGIVLTVGAVYLTSQVIK